MLLMIRTMDLREAHLPNQRNDMASHLDTYCSYAGEMGLADDRDLSFMSKEDAVRRMQSFIGMFGGRMRKKAGEAKRKPT